MYKILVVDDERIIRDGIIRIIPWQKHGYILSGSAENGWDAWEQICREQPQVVITDVKMPGLDGLGLIAKVAAAFPQIRFIVLSGYGEFEIAKEAMHYGVKHYLLKPCNEKRIIEVLEDLRAELALEEEREVYIQKNREQLEHVLPLVKEQFIRDFVSLRHYTREEYDYYCSLLGISQKPLRMILWEPVGEYGVSEVFGLMGIVEAAFGAEKYLNTVIKNHILSLVETAGDEDLLHRLGQIQQNFGNYYRLEVNLAYSGVFEFEQAPAVYQELSKCLRYALYLGAGSVITPRDLGGESEFAVGRELIFDYDALAVAAKSGDQAAAGAEIDRFFRQLHQYKFGWNVWRTYTTELFMVLIRQCQADELKGYLDRLADLDTLGTPDEMEKFIVDAGMAITRANHEMIRNKHHKIIATLLKYISENLDNEDLSLKRLAGEVVFTNEGYLSKLFLKETNEKFSHYLMRLRMEKAKELIENNGADRIYEVAQSVGLGNNPQYFSQLFKKYTGYSPSDYKKVK
jgi:two-component system response regulator YesN